MAEGKPPLAGGTRISARRSTGGSQRIALLSTSTSISSPVRCLPHQQQEDRLPRTPQVSDRPPLSSRSPSCAPIVRELPLQQQEDRLPRTPQVSQTPPLSSRSPTTTLLVRQLPPPAGRSPSKRPARFPEGSAVEQEPFHNTGSLPHRSWKIACQEAHEATRGHCCQPGAPP